jgi:S-adenosylmethionine-diacylgycerolhomoserine-N-methlytransferase
MNWYDIAAPIYDRAISRTYLPYRKLAIRALRLQPGLSVLDIGCGTGLNFELILNEIGTQGTLIGIDSSRKMLERAQKRIEQKCWTNVHLIQKDARTITQNDLEVLTGRSGGIDRIVCTLGFSVFPDWQAVFETTFGLLNNVGRYCIMDIFNDNITIRTRIVRFLAHSDNSRRVWEPLKKKCQDYKEEKYPMAHGDVVVVASGNKATSP